MKVRDILAAGPSHPQHGKARSFVDAVEAGSKILAIDGVKTTPGMTYMQKQQALAALRAHLNQTLSLMGEFGHVDEMDAVTRELFRDLRGTLNGAFMEEVG